MGKFALKVTELEELFLRSRKDWRIFFDELESGEASHWFDDPWRNLDPFLEVCEEEDRRTFVQALEEMLVNEVPEDQAMALAIVAGCREPFPLHFLLEREDALSANLEVRLELILAVGQRNYQDGRPVVEKGLQDARCRHAASIALAQLDPQAAGPYGREYYEQDRPRILVTLNRPLTEHEYATFYQMAIGTYEVQGKEGLNTFLRAVAQNSPELAHEMALVARRLVRQEQATGDA